MATHYDSSAYKLKYYHVHQDPDGNIVRLEIHERTDRQPVAKKIAALCGLTLSIQGGQAEVDAAIIKTSLSISLVDRSDKPEYLETATRTYVKQGNWEEFYTQDSTLYLVVVKVMQRGMSQYVDRWRGYITPDSWEESLDYYGTITITARDNIGHLSDMDFDATGDGDGLISVKGLINAALDKVACPLDSHIMDQEADDSYLLSQDGTSIYDMYLNVEQFKDSNWYDALETVLGDLGLTLRFWDGADLYVDSVRNLSLCGETEYASMSTMELIFTDGTRTKTPPYKEIETNLKYDVEQTVEYPLLKGLEFSTASSGATYSMRCVIKGPGSTSIVTRTGAEELDNTVANTGPGWSTTSGTGLLMNHKKGTRNIYEGTKQRTGIDPDNVVFAGINLTDSNERQACYNFGRVNSLECIFRLKYFSGMFQMDTDSSGKQDITEIAAYLTGFKWRMYYENPDGTVYAYNNDAKYWWNTEYLNTFSTEEQFTEVWEIDLSKAGGKSKIKEGGTLYFYIKEITAENTENLFRQGAGGIYIGFNGIEMETVGSTVGSDKVKTINNENYNIKNSKDARLGAISRPIFWQNVKNYLNVLYRKDTTGVISMAGYDFSWGDSDGETPMGAYPNITIPGATGAYPLPVLIHLERLLWHGATRDILEGTCKIKYKYSIALDVLFEYKGKFYIVLSGTIDYLNAMMSAQFVEVTGAKP